MVAIRSAARELNFNAVPSPVLQTVNATSPRALEMQPGQGSLAPAPMVPTLAALIPSRETIESAINKISQVVWKDLEKLHRLGKTIAVAPHTALAPALTFEVYKADDPRVKDDPLRAGLKDSVWVDSGGLVELLNNFSRTTPVSQMLTVGGGIFTSNLAQYRVILPYKKDGKPAEELIARTPFSLPTTADMAKAWPKGGEFFMHASTSVQGMANITGGPLMSLGFTTANIGAAAEIGTKYAGDVILGIKRLDGNKMRVTLEKASNHMNELAAELRAGLQGTIPLWGHGALPTVVTRQAPQRLLDLVARYSAGRMRVGQVSELTEQATTSFEFDLDSRDAADAYAAVFRMDFSGAEKLALAAQHGVNTGVTCKSLLQTKNSDGTTWLVEAVRAQLLLRNTLRSHTRADFTDTDGSHTWVRKALLHKEKSSAWHGHHEVDWNYVQVRRTDGEYEPYLQLVYKGEKKVTLPVQIESVFGLAAALGDPAALAKRDNAEKAIANLSRLSYAQRLLSQADDTKTHAEVYFTQAGIANLAKTTPQDAEQAYLKAISVLDPAYRALPLLDASGRARAQDIIQRYIFLKKHNFVVGLTARRQRTALRTEYQAAFHRNLDADTTVTVRAKDFATRMAELPKLSRVAGPESRAAAVSKFFMDLGQSYGYEYGLLAAILAQLAGTQNVVVHDITLTGTDLAMRFGDGKNVEDPLAALNRRLGRISLLAA